VTQRFLANNNNNETAKTKLPVIIYRFSSCNDASWWDVSLDHHHRRLVQEDMQQQLQQQQ
jgi:hypothetical protein